MMRLMSTRSFLKKKKIKIEAVFNGYQEMETTSISNVNSSPANG